jgi:hypothetical protein
MQVPGNVMTLPWMAPGNKHAIGSFLQRFDNIEWIDPSGAGYPDNTHVRGILNSADPGKIRTGVSTPVADDGYNFGFPTFFRLMFHNIISGGISLF